MGGFLKGFETKGREVAKINVQSAIFVEETFGKGRRSWDR